MRSLSPVSRTLLLALPLLVATAIGCKKEYDTPPVRTLGSGNVVTIAQLKAMYQGSPVHFSDSANAVNTVYAVVTADEQNGNLYKNVYVQDNTGAIAVRLLFSGGLYQGDSIRIYLPGTVLSPYNGLMQIDSVNVDNNIVKQATGVYVAPTPTTMTELATQAGLGGSLQSKLITLSGVEFIPGDTGLTYADPVNQLTLNRTLENCSGDTAVVRSSGYGNFAGTHLPTGKGTFTGIASWFGSAAQLYVRDINEVQLDGPRCGLASCDPANSLNENFDGVLNNADVNTECWLDLFTTGTGKWKGKIIGSESFVEVAPPSFDASSVSWLISAPLQYSAGMQLSFISSLGSVWQHDGVEVLISTDINLTTAASVLAAPWQNVTGATLAGSTTPVGTLTTIGSWVPSGNIDLTPYLTAGTNFVVAFKYSGNPATQATRYRIDNVSVQ
jgi:hypothetical protein